LKTVFGRQTLGERESGTKRLEESVTAYRDALQEYTRERVPLDWAMTQNNLGNALETLGKRESGTKQLQDAMTAYQASIEVFVPAGGIYTDKVTEINIHTFRVCERSRATDVGGARDVRSPPWSFAGRAAALGPCDKMTKLEARCLRRGAARPLRGACDAPPAGR
jgi:hypothetical protein